MPENSPKRRGIIPVVPVGSRFGLLTVLSKGKSILSPTTNCWATTWTCECDCGETIDRRRESILRSPETQSCGCRKAERARTLAKPPLFIGDKFNRLTVVGELGADRPKCYKLKCDCGNIRYVKRSDFANPNSKQKSCGCYRNERSKLNTLNNIEVLTGSKYSSLLVKELWHERTIQGKAIWVCECDCGNRILKNAACLKASTQRKSFLNCGDRSKHPEGFGLRYPPMPSPMPEGVGILYSQFSKFTKTRLIKNRNLIEDVRRDRLLRVCWIVHYREVKLGENLSKEYIRNYIVKSLRRLTIDAFWEEKLESHGGFMVDSSGRIRKAKLVKRGVEVANLTFPSYPVSFDSGENILSTRPHKLRFRRC